MAFLLYFLLPGVYGNWSQAMNCQMLPREKQTTTQFECDFQWHENLTYLTLMTVGIL